MAYADNHEANRIEYLEARLANALKLRDDVLKDCNALRARLYAVTAERDDALNYHGYLRGEAAKHEKRARGAEEQLVKAVHVVRPTIGEDLLDAAQRVVKQRDDHCKALRTREEVLAEVGRALGLEKGENEAMAARRVVAERDRLRKNCSLWDVKIDGVTVSAADYEATVGRFGTAPKPEPLTVADVESIVDAKLAAAPRQAGTWMGSGLHRVRHWPGLMVAAHVTPDGWHVYGEVGGLLASGYSTGIEGQRAADAALLAMGVKLL